MFYFARTLTRSNIRRLELSHCFWFPAGPTRGARKVMSRRSIGLRTRPNPVPHPRPCRVSQLRNQRQGLNPPKHRRSPPGRKLLARPKHLRRRYRLSLESGKLTRTLPRNSITSKRIFQPAGVPRLAGRFLDTLRVGFYHPV